jgi:CheY-like chemotaxis protein
MDIQLHNTLVNGKSHSGIDLSKIIKSDEKTKDIPILLATAHAMREQKESFLNETGAEGYVAKPVHDFDALIVQIRKCLDSKGLQKKSKS